MGAPFVSCSWVAVVAILTPQTEFNGKWVDPVKSVDVIGALAYPAQVPSSERRRP